MSEDITTTLRLQAYEIAAESHAGWGNTMTYAAEIIDQLRKEKEQLLSDYGSLVNELYDTAEERDQLRKEVEHLKEALECVALDRCTCNDKVTAGACSSCFASQELAKVRGKVDHE